MGIVLILGSLHHGRLGYQGFSTLAKDVFDQHTFAVAGLWQRTKTGNGLTIMTCDPNELVAPIHPKAMITILHPADIETWLHESYDEVVALQRPSDAAAMAVRGPVFPTRER